MGVLHIHVTLHYHCTNVLSLCMFLGFENLNIVRKSSFFRLVRLCFLCMSELFSSFLSLLLSLLLELLVLWFFFLVNCCFKYVECDVAVSWLCVVHILYSSFEHTSQSLMHFLVFATNDINKIRTFVYLHAQIFLSLSMCCREKFRVLALPTAEYIVR